jgi:hypothetical protein
MIARRGFRTGLAALAVSACAVTAFSVSARAQSLFSADMATMYADPAKYLLYGCRQLAQARPPLLYRIQKLEALMARAQSGGGGVLAANMAYRNEYLSARGDLQNLDARAADRSCPPMPQTAIAPPTEAPVVGTVPDRRTTPR